MNTSCHSTLRLAIFVSLVVIATLGTKNQTVANPFQVVQDMQIVVPQEDEKKKESETKKDTLSPLISAKELKALIDADDGSLRIVEPAKSSKDYMAGHIPSAQYLHWVTDMTDPESTERYTILSKEQFGKLMVGLGINNQSRIIIYDRLSSRLSTRLFWTLKYYGHQQVQILDGGHQAWSSSKFKESTEKVKFGESKYDVPKPRAEILAEMDFVKQHLEDPKTKFIDGRPAEQFKGEVVGRVFHTNQPHPRKGHIPNAINIFWKDNFNDKGLFKSKDELMALYKDAGIKPDQCVVTYCNEGLHAAPPWFVLTQLLEYKDVRLYDSSMAEWANSDHPMATAKASKGTKKESGSTAKSSVTPKQK